jgi:transposase
MKSGSEPFLCFLTQLRQKTPEKQIVIILDNASIHKSKKVKGFLKRHTNIHLLYLPTYSPEYNPVELFWKWLKPKVYGFSAFGGISELISRFRKLVWHYNRGELNNPIKFNLRAYEKIL